MIEYGTATFEQTIDWSSENGPITIVEIPAESYHIADDLEPKWDGFVQGGDPISKSLTVTASTNRVWQPTYSGMIEFDKEQGDGIKELRLANTSDISLAFTIDMNGTYEWGAFDEMPQEDLRLPRQSSLIRTQLGPVPIDIELESTEILDPAIFWMTVYDKANLVLESSGNYSEETIFRSTDPSPWTQQSQITNSSLNGLSDGDSGFDGAFDTRYTNSVLASILGNIEINSILTMHGTLEGRSLIEHDPNSSNSSGGSFSRTVSGEEALSINGGVVSWLNHKEIIQDENQGVSQSISLQEDGVDNIPAIELSDPICERSDDGHFHFKFSLSSSDKRNICSYYGIRVGSKRTIMENDIFNSGRDMTVFPESLISDGDEMVYTDESSLLDTGSGYIRSSIGFCIDIVNDARLEMDNNMINFDAKMPKDCRDGKEFCVSLRTPGKEDLPAIGSASVKYAIPADPDAGISGNTGAEFKLPDILTKCTRCGTLSTPPPTGRDCAANPITLSGQRRLDLQSHLFLGEISYDNVAQRDKGKGYHHQLPNTTDRSSRVTTIDPASSNDPQNDPYAGEVDFYYPGEIPPDGAKVTERKTFFPNSWDQTRVLDTIMAALNKWCPDQSGSERVNMRSELGFDIRIVYSNTSEPDIITAYPEL